VETVERALQQTLKLRAANLDGSEAREMGRQELRVE
jgi:hypothetical protein